VQDRALDHPLEARGGLRVGIVLGLQGLVFLVEILLHHLAQFGKVHAAGGHHLGRVLVVDEREEEVFQRRIFVPPLGRIAERVVERAFKVLGETGHGLGLCQERADARGRRAARGVWP